MNVSVGLCLGVGFVGCSLGVGGVGLLLSLFPFPRPIMPEELVGFGELLVRLSTIPLFAILGVCVGFLGYDAVSWLVARVSQHRRGRMI